MESDKDINAMRSCNLIRLNQMCFFQSSKMETKLYLVCVLLFLIVLKMMRSQTSVKKIPFLHYVKLCHYHHMIHVIQYMRVQYVIQRTKWHVIKAFEI